MYFCYCFSVNKNHIYICDKLYGIGIAGKFYFDIKSLRINSSGYSYRRVEETSTNKGEKVYCISDIRYDLNTMQQFVTNVQLRYDTSVIDEKQRKSDASVREWNNAKRNAFAAKFAPESSGEIISDVAKIKMKNKSEYNFYNSSIIN